MTSVDICTKCDERPATPKEWCGDASWCQECTDNYDGPDEIDYDAPTAREQFERAYKEKRRIG